MAFFSCMFLQKCSSGDYVKGDKRLKSSIEIQKWNERKTQYLPSVCHHPLLESFDVLTPFLPGQAELILFISSFIHSFILHHITPLIEFHIAEHSKKKIKGTLHNV